MDSLSDFCHPVAIIMVAFLSLVLSLAYASKGFNQEEAIWESAYMTIRASKLPAKEAEFVEAAVKLTTALAVGSNTLKDGEINDLIAGLEKGSHGISVEGLTLIHEVAVASRDGFLQQRRDMTKSYNLYKLEKLTKLEQALDNQLNKGRSK